ncbi:MAG: hypothetical protein NXH86_17380, partial [Flavobacteriaceae bacterium]|nr:hypothetical protein [Flavobacteriaceae bacterium]
RRMLGLVVENQPHGALAHFRGKLVRGLAHDAPPYSGVGASGKPGAVQFADFEANFSFTPTHSVVVNLKKARKHLQSFELIDQIIAEKTFHSFRRALSAKCFSKSIRRRFKKQISAVASIEQSFDHRLHFHILIQKPHFIHDEDFERAIKETAKSNPYVETGTYSIDIISLADKTPRDIKNIIQYNMKNISKENARFVM